MKILITGAAGFLGSALARHLSKIDCQISLLVRRHANLFRIPDLDKYKIERVETDLEVGQVIAVNSPDIVIHTATCYGRNGESASQIIDSNIRLGILILEALSKLPKKTTFLNSASVLSEDVSFYALTKNQFEKLGIKYCNQADIGIQFINIKLQHMYGPGDDDSKFVSFVIHSCQKNVPILPLTHGEQKRDFIYIDDVLDAYLKIIENVSRLDNQVQIELGSGQAVSIKDFVELAHRITGSKTQLGFGQIPFREYDGMCLVANTLILNKLGWTPKFSIESGMKKMIHLESLS